MRIVKYLASTIPKPGQYRGEDSRQAACNRYDATFARIGIENLRQAIRPLLERCEYGATAFEY
ncbi:hypothetical protein Pla144_36180 [Bythopirellula polymerisocia]|uniref:Uncharacterized protein n=1 Tax=Bythopirellula polymerisocia TaxID=2528003 RepID=A0A5C6CK15_9BACT|nr:hypothetical protein Pla144_36180 [Bythopirellula polymerisocia]